MDWHSHAQRLAGEVTDPVSRWREPVAATPRHVFVPRWWENRVLRNGPDNEAAWFEAAYSDRTLVTRLGPLHADAAEPDDRPEGLPTSSATLPSLMVRMYRHGRLFDGADILDVGTGSGYGCALLAKRFGDAQVTSVDVDPYLSEAASQRLAATGLHPRVETVDATGPLPGTYDRIVASVSVKPIPAGWMAALRPGGRLVTVIAGTTAILTATKQNDGWAEGRIEWDRAGFMAARSCPDYPPDAGELFTAIEYADGEEVTTGRYPVIQVAEAWELSSVLEITAPGITHYYDETEDGTRTAWMVHADKSWARATAHGTDAPVVHQGGPRRLWDILDELRDYWLSHGYFHLYGAQAFIPPEGGKIHLARGDWQATIV
ncbi:methyltransferase domain-containing protein [Actinoallomurus rhizosphaericola]|uniref:methyltransferase domain-containing protein n=1 Tax=Actinoallomurus rhizosphaericola TaxID=2952536 RepID=UPI0020909CFE|nr:methyltransferase domain-containing protein [Actinoallomurus rhizosphaericola]MCO5994475.1 methyltransferase domain-containing protein [Actinoallomurus rhizosphaericola]